ncbi:MAG: KUP/HAK/KT family potassium transporter [bacterium]
MIKNSKFFENIRPLGIVFGDIGTSPLYTVSLIAFTIKNKDPLLIMGGISLIFWLLIIIVYIQYVFIVMNLSIRGEGGQLIIREYALSLVKNNPFLKSLVSFLGLFGFCAIVSEGILTPAISILSSSEGLKMIETGVNFTTFHVILIATLITIGLFSLQKKGTDKVSFLFTPIIALWFIFLFLTGLFYILKEPGILKAINPIYIVYLFKNDPIDFLIVLSFAMLAITGVEGMYADMGHLGKKPIVFSWNLVFISLITNYFGQGAFFLLNHHKITEYNSLIFYMVKSMIPSLYIPAIILTLLATVIASQAMISAMFSIFYQTSNLNLLPRIKYIHTSSELKHQIYVPFVNWFLMILVLLTIIIFKSSNNIANAYGLSVNITIVISCIISAIIFWHQQKIITVILLLLVILPVDLVVLISNFHKIIHGGYFPFITALILISIVMIYINGNKKLGKKLKYTSYHEFLNKYEEFYNSESKIKGQAIFLLRDINYISPYISKTIFDFKIIYEKNILLSINITDKPYKIEYHLKNLEDKHKSLYYLEIKSGYLEIINIPEILDKLNIQPTTVFYGQENINSRNIFVKFYSLLKKISPTIVDFYNFPLSKTIGITTNLEI